MAHPGALSRLFPSVSIITKAKCTLPGSSSQCFPDTSPALDFIASPRLISASVSHGWCLSLPSSPIFVFSTNSDLLFSPSPLVLPQQHLHSTASLPPPHPAGVLSMQGDTSVFRFSRVQASCLQMPAHFCGARTQAECLPLSHQVGLTGPGGFSSPFSLKRRSVIQKA